MSKKNLIKVVKIINDEKIVINVGASSGISYNDRFEVYTDTNVEIRDPDTYEDLGRLKYIKATVRPQYIDEKYSICVNIKNDSTSLRDILSYQSYFDANLITPASLNVNPEDISGGFSNIIKEIRVGDPVQKANAN